MNPKRLLTALSLWALAITCWLPASAHSQAEQGPTDLRTRKTGSDWPRFLGPRIDGKSTETGIRQAPKTLPQIWQIDAGEGYATPVTSLGRLFHFDRLGDRARLLCLNAETGETLWESTYPTQYEDYYDYSNGPRASALVDGDRVYTFGVEGLLRSHRVIDGKLLWQVDTSAKFGVIKNFFGVGSSPAIEGDLLITMVGGSPNNSPKIHSGDVKGNGTGIVAFNKYTGAVVYTLSDELASYSALQLATIANRRWGFAFTRGGLVGFDPTNGSMDFHLPWRAKVLESVNAATPIVDGDTVFISETYGPGSAWLRVKPGAYEVLRSEEKTRDKSLELHWNTPVLHNNHLFGSSGRNSGNAELRSVDFSTGQVRWRQPGLKRANVLWVDDHLLVVGEYGDVLLIEANPLKYVVVSDLTPKREDGKASLRFPVWGPPVISHGLLYLRSKDKLTAYELLPQAPAETTENTTSETSP